MAGAYSSAYSSAYDVGGGGGGFLSAFAIGCNQQLEIGAMLKNVSGQKIGAQLVSATDGSAFTGSVTVSVTGDAGTQATGSVGSGACTHEGNGYHTYAPAQAETNYDLVAFTFTGTGAVPVTVQVYTLPTTGVLSPATLGRTLVVDASGLADANVVKLGPTGSGTAQTATDLGAINVTNLNTLSGHDPGGTLASSANQSTIAGYIDTEVATIVSELAKVPKSDSNVTWNATALASINAEADTALSDYDPPTYTELLNMVRLLARKDSALATDLSTLLTAINADLSSGGGTYANTTDSQEALRDRGDAAWITATSVAISTAGMQALIELCFTYDATATYAGADAGSLVKQIADNAGGSGSNPFTIATGTIGATGNDTTHLHLTGLPYGDDELNDYLIVIYDDSASEYHSRWILDWADTGDLATVAALPFTPEDSTDTYTVLAVRQDVTGGSGLDAAGVRAALGFASASYDTDIAALPTAAEIRSEIDSNSTQLAAILADTAEIGTAGAGLSAIPWNASWDAEVQSECNDALVALNLDKVYSASASVSDASATTTQFKTTLTEADNFWSDTAITFTSGALAGISRVIYTYQNTNGTIVIDEALPAAPANGVTFLLHGIHSHSQTDIVNGVWSRSSRTLTGIDEDSTTLDLDATIRAAVGLASANLDTQLTAIVGDTNELQTDLTNGGRLDLLIDTVVADTTQIKADLPTRPTRGVQLDDLMFMMVDDTDLNTPETGVTVTATISKDGGSFASCSNSVTEVSGGWYKITLTSTEMTANSIAVKFTGTGCAQRNMSIRTQPT